MLFFGKRMVDETGKITDKNLKVLSIRDMKERIIQSITIDTFIKYQNGNLVSDFYNKDIQPNINKYNNSILFSKLDMSKEEDTFYFKKVLS